MIVDLTFFVMNLMGRFITKELGSNEDICHLLLLMD